MFLCVSWRSCSLRGESNNAAQDAAAHEPHAAAHVMSRLTIGRATLL